jgi:hypothetical protein
MFKQLLTQLLFPLLWFFYGAAAQRGLWAPHSRGFRDHTHDAPQSVGFLWTSDQSVAETSTWQYITLTTDRHPCPRRDICVCVCVCVYVYICIYIYIYNIKFSEEFITPALLLNVPV